MLKIIQVEINEYKQCIKDLFLEYFQWANLMAMQEFYVSFDTNVVLEQDMSKLYQFAPPEGRLLLGKWEDEIVGCVGLRRINSDVAEIKRMFVRPEYRKRQIGRLLLGAIISEAHQSNYSRLRLDSAPFAREAQALYSSFGFYEIKPYSESEAPEQYLSLWSFMELSLN